MDLSKINDYLKDKSPKEIVEWAIETANRPVVTTNFRPYEAAILHAATRVKNDIPVIWCDTGYNTPQTYRHAERVIDNLDLNIHLYVPQQTAAHRDVVMGIPDIDSPLHKEFTKQVKLEPFQRAMKEHQPDVWFTNLRKGQTAFRDSLDIVTLGSDGVLKVSPFFYWSDEDLDKYLEENQLENEFRYYDPTKVLENRECGLHVPAQKQTVSS
ncbi:phosphoadenosine phosphosulfate reductase family protein [Sinomicrobium kalidii]|uniref:phosphoadenosine phosphosulfate reductase domain-containing protein n=1 Tax=Sinomicrobium kalidii TaxID=2900738 RepID=UPI001E5DC7EB|nr:phosphoadenosine phosphosulfate reductase family protein [Sinomicrobium kalidii]UGU14587.1 phosphoadenosine phosphosulfate reductase family protein [Sinomicrobium kalidii]